MFVENFNPPVHLRRGDVVGVGLVSSRSGADEGEDMQQQMKLWMEKGHDKVWSFHRFETNRPDMNCLWCSHFCLLTLPLYELYFLFPVYSCLSRQKLDPDQQRERDMRRAINAGKR